MFAKMRAFLRGVPVHQVQREDVIRELEGCISYDKKADYILHKIEKMMSANFIHLIPDHERVDYLITLDKALAEVQYAGETDEVVARRVARMRREGLLSHFGGSVNALSNSNDAMKVLNHAVESVENERVMHASSEHSYNHWTDMLQHVVMYNHAIGALQEQDQDFLTRQVYGQLKDMHEIAYHSHQTRTQMMKKTAEVVRYAYRNTGVIDRDDFLFQAQDDMIGLMWKALNNQAYDCVSIAEVLLDQTFDASILRGLDQDNIAEYINHTQELIEGALRSENEGDGGYDWDDHVMPSLSYEERKTVIDMMFKKTVAPSVLDALPLENRIDHLWYMRRIIEDERKRFWDENYRNKLIRQLGSLARNDDIASKLPEKALSTYISSSVHDLLEFDTDVSRKEACACIEKYPAFVRADDIEKAGFNNIHAHADDMEKYLEIMGAFLENSNDVVKKKYVASLGEYKDELHTAYQETLIQLGKSPDVDVVAQHALTLSQKTIHLISFLNKYNV